MVEGPTAGERTLKEPAGNSWFWFFLLVNSKSLMSQKPCTPRAMMRGIALECDTNVDETDFNKENYI